MNLTFVTHILFTVDLLFLTKRAVELAKENLSPGESHILLDAEEKGIKITCPEIGDLDVKEIKPGDKVEIPDDAVQCLLQTNGEITLVYPKTSRFQVS